MNKKIKEGIRFKLVSEYRQLFFKDTTNAVELREVIGKILDDILYHDHTNIPEQEKDKIVMEIIDEFVGFGPIEDLIKDRFVTEIMINGPDKIYVERHGKTELAHVSFDSEQQLLHLIEKILLPTRRHVDESNPYTDVSLKDGSRVNIIIPPLAIDGPTVTIRRFLKEIGRVEDLVNLGSLDKRMADFLVASILAKINIIFSGATGAGKTTTLNVLTSYIPNKERIVTIEDTAELRLIQDHVVRLEGRQPNIEGRGEVSIRTLFKNSLRMRPDRIILGEIRGGEALDMLQAICSGHSGSLAVIHANSPQDVIYRLETMILTSGVPIILEAIHRQIAAAVNLIVQQEQLADGTRKVTHISQVKSSKETGVCVEDIFLYELEEIDSEGKVKGQWKATGVTPLFYQSFKKAGITLPENMFKADN